MWQHSTSCLWFLNWEPKDHVPLNVGSMNLLGFKWYPCVSYWADKPAHKAELFRSKDKNLHWSLDWTLEHKESECIKRMLLLPCCPRNITTNSWFMLFPVVYPKYSVEVKSWSFNMPDLFVELSVFASETEWPWPSTWEENGNKIFPAVKLDWFSNHSLTDLTEAKGNGTFKHMDS